MEGGVIEKSGSPSSKPLKFSVYQNPTLSAALTANSICPTKSTFLFIFSISTASAFVLLSIISREDGFIDNLRLRHVSQSKAYLVTKIIQFIVGLVFVGTVFALIRAFLLQRARNVWGIQSVYSSKEGGKEKRHLSERQLTLLGLKPKAMEKVESDSAKKPPKSKPYSGFSPSDPLFPLHHTGPSPSRSHRISAEKASTSGGSRSSSFYTPSKSPGSPSSLYLVPSPSLQGSSVKTSPGVDRIVSSPWSKQRTPTGKDVATEEMLEQFLADVDEKFTVSAVIQTTPPPTLGGFGIASPTPVGNSANTSGTTRSTPLRPVRRMSPSSQKLRTPPKKGEGDLPQPMSIEESIEAFENMGIYPEIEQWRDRLRQWFSSVLLNPLVDKIETTHIQVMQTAAKLGISITINQVGSDSTATTVPSTVSPIDGTKEWQSSFTVDEDGLLHQLRATLVQALDASASKLPLSHLQQPQQQNPLIPAMQECVDAITEHQRLHALMKGEWVKGLLPQSSVRADYTVQRIIELAEGTCLKNYEYLGTGEVYDKVNKKWTLELPTDSHLLLYLFCAFLEHPKWMLHVDPTSYASAQSSKNPLFLGVLPPKERFPEKYVAVISGVPSILHPGACVLVVGKQSPPLFALYWDKKLQFSLQGRTALWDAILLLCHRINVGYGAVVRGMHLGSSAFSILPVIDLEADD
ncbi:cytochrome B561, amino-terminal protein [Thalictrum thalictroides]|uniref:Cytochrome B561, amino-terminal protein n=1 Tax=Thalictrum thalictroides TaxID=46969 RepID=A0A7J6UT55_THATH|nr:cytochrome B561, amino-terminal protein [Thalictrum thalictroides]